MEKKTDLICLNMYVCGLLFQGEVLGHTVFWLALKDLLTNMKVIKSQSSCLHKIFETVEEPERGKTQIPCCPT